MQGCSIAYQQDLFEQNFPSDFDWFYIGSTFQTFNTSLTSMSDINTSLTPEPFSIKPFFQVMSRFYFHCSHSLFQNYYLAIFWVEVWSHCFFRQRNEYPNHYQTPALHQTANSSKIMSSWGFSLKTIENSLLYYNFVCFV